MNANIKTETGVNVTMTRTHLQIISSVVPDELTITQLCAVIPVHDEILESTLISNRAMCLAKAYRLGRGALLAISVRGNTSVATALVDLSHPDIARWPAKAQGRSYLPVLLQSHDKSRVIRVGIDANLMEAFDNAKACEPVGTDDTSDLLVHFLRALDQPEELRGMSIEPGQLLNATLSLIVSSPSSAAGETTSNAEY